MRIDSLSVLDIMPPFLSMVFVVVRNKKFGLFGNNKSIFYRLAKKVNSVFASIIFIQYTASSIIICVSVVLLSQMPLSSPRFMGLFTYLSCMLLQIFMACAAGQEATIQVINTI